MSVMIGGQCTLQKNKVKEITFLQKVFTALVLLMPALSVYATIVPGFNLGELFIILWMPVMLADMVRKRTRLRYSPFWMYLIYALFSTVVITVFLLCFRTSFSPVKMVVRVIRDGMYFIIICLFGAEYFDYSYAKQFLTRLTYILGFYMYLQFAVYLLFGIYISGFIPFLPSALSGGLTFAGHSAHYLMSASYDGYVRANGFYAEPAVCAQCISIALLLTLFPSQGEGKVNYKRAAVFTAFMLPTFSVNAYIAIIVCWGLHIVYVIFSGKMQAIWIYAIIVLATIGIILFFLNDASRSVFMRLVNLFAAGQVTGSSAVRVLRGPAFFMCMPLFYQIFGIGFGNFLSFRESYGITTVFEEPTEYMNTNAYILTSSGIIGFVLFYTTLIAVVRSKITASKMLLCLLFVFSISSSLYSSPQFVAFMLFILYSPEMRSKNAD